jgi:hypothetical protein
MSDLASATFPGSSFDRQRRGSFTYLRTVPVPECAITSSKAWPSHWRFEASLPCATSSRTWSQDLGAQMLPQSRTLQLARPWHSRLHWHLTFPLRRVASPSVAG